MMLRCFSAVTAVLAVAQALPTVAQEPITVTFGGDVFDVTGAGTLDLGDLDAVLKPFRRGFKDERDPLGLDVTVDAAGAVVACRADATDRRNLAAQAVCAHVLRTGRFRPFPLLELDFTRAT